MEDKYINPFTDFGFKKLFGEEPNKDLLINFLNTLLPERHKISDLSYTKSERMEPLASTGKRYWTCIVLPRHFGKRCLTSSLP